MMTTLGIDLSSKAKNTFACKIDWRQDGSVSISGPEPYCDDETLHSLIAMVDAIGIDAPFGWPVPFAEAVADWRFQGWVGDEAFQRSLRYRATDLEVQRVVKLWPLSVSTDRIALPAMRAMALLRKAGVVDKSGLGGRFFEVYPAATLKGWQLPFNGYKSDGSRAPGAALECRREIINALNQALPGYPVPESYANSDHALDALLSALTARAAKMGNSLEPSSDQRGLARREGWIHIPKFSRIHQCVTS